MANYQTANHDIRPDHEIDDTEGHETLGVERARSAETTGRVRIILAVSFALAVICLGVVMLSFASGI
jgi:hypothetical protein